MDTSVCCHILAKHLTDAYITSWVGNANISLDIHRVINLEEVYDKAREKTSSFTHIWIVEEKYLPKDIGKLCYYLSLNKEAMVPLMTSSKSDFSNFWGDLDDYGFYKESNDYLNIVNKQIIGTLVVPYIMGNILFRTDVLLSITNTNEGDFDMSVCTSLRNKRIPMWVNNEHDIGNCRDFTSVVFHNSPDIWKLDNILSKFMLDFLANPSRDIFKKIGHDIWQFPFFTKEFCDALVLAAIKQNTWSKGGDSYYDERIENDENYPTQDIHLKDLGLDTFWEEVIVDKCFKIILDTLYNYEVKDYNIAFIARYAKLPGIKAQTKLSPHHDSSVYTTNIALSEPNKDYIGGGCRFIYKNITLANIPKGHITLHPGRVTHYHEGLEITSGTRYILVSFNN